MAANGSEGDRDGNSELAGLAAMAVTFLTLTVAFGLLALGFESFWVAFPIGFGGLLPLSVGLANWYESRGERARDRASAPTGETDDALAVLRERYARGELDEAEFEAQVERLLETESVADADALFEVDDPSGVDSSADPTEEFERN